MQTIQFEIENNIYQNLINSGMDIQNKFKEFLLEYDFIDNDYPSIGTQEAKRRVAESVEEYQLNGSKGATEFTQDYWDDLDKFIDNVEAR